MLVATFLLFLIPLWLLGSAWSGSFRATPRDVARDWRWYFLIASVLAGTILAIAAIVSSFSWSYNGGSPHGLLPRPGVWMSLRPIIKWSLIASLLLALVGRGRSRLLVIASTFSVLFVEWALAVVEMD